MHIMAWHLCYIKINITLKHGTLRGITELVLLRHGTFLARHVWTRDVWDAPFKWITPKFPSHRWSRCRMQPVAKVETGQWTISIQDLDGTHATGWAGHDTISAAFIMYLFNFDSLSITQWLCPPQTGRSWVASDFVGLNTKETARKKWKGIFFSLSLSHTITIIVGGEVLIQHSD